MDDASVNHEAALEDLLSLWQRRRDEGEPATPAELCRERPELLPELERRIAVLEQMNALAGAVHGTATLNTAGSAPSTNTSPGVHEGDLSAAASLPVAMDLRGYELIEPLGKGGMGEVYRSCDPALHRDLAIKVMAASLRSHEEAERRFLREARITGSLQHPGIVAVYNLGRLADGRLHYTMRLVRGRTFADILKDEAGKPERLPALLAIFEKVCEAVAYAHSKRVIHRDLKPGNVMVGKFGEVQVVDWGLAKLLSAEGGPADEEPRIAAGGTLIHTEAADTPSDLTWAGSGIGTPEYMSPEQAQGDWELVDERADVFALGAILCVILTGRSPYGGRDSMEVLRRARRGDLTEALDRLEQCGADGALTALCRDCLGVERQQRPRDAGVVARRVADYKEVVEQRLRQAELERTAAEVTSREERKRRRLALGLSAAVVLVLIAGTLVSALFGLGAEQARRSEANRALSEATAKKEADHARRDAQRKLVELCGASGITAAHEGDHSLALLWFARALQNAQDDPQQEELNRIRMANWLRQVCLPEGAFAIPGFRQNQDRFRTFQFSPDGNYLLVIASTGACLVWDRTHGRFVELPGAAAQATAAAWQPDSGLLTVAGKTARIHFLAPPTFQPVDELAADGKVTVLAFSRNGKRLAWGGSHGARVWDVQEKKYLTPLLPHDGPVLSLSFSFGGDRLATAAHDIKARVFRVPCEQAEPVFPPVPHILGDDVYTHGGPDRVIPRFAAGDRFLLTVAPLQANDTSLVWRSAETGKPLTDITSLEYRNLGVFTVSDQGDYVAALGEDRGRLWDAQSRRSLSAIPAPPHLSWNEHLTFSADGKILVTCGHDTRARFWHVEDRGGDFLAPAYPPVYHPMQAVRVNLSPDGRHLATALWDGTVHLWRCPAGAPAAYSLPTNGASLPALSPEKRFVLPRGLTYRNGTLQGTRVYETESGKAAGPKLDPGGILLDATFSPDGTRVVTASSTARTPSERNQRLFQPQGKGGNVQIWDWKTGQRVVGPIPTPGEPRGLAFRGDGSNLAVVCADYRVVLVDPKTGSITCTLDPGLRTRPQNANQWISNGEARFSPDGRFLVTWEMTPHVHVWDPDRGQLLHRLPHTERIHHIVFHPTNPELMATCGWGSEARIWNLTTGKLVAALKHPQWVSQLQFAADGRELITSCDDGVLRVWDWQAGKIKDGWPLHPSTLADFRFLADRRALVSVGPVHSQVTDWRTKTPITPLWDHRPDFDLTVETSSGDHRAIVGGLGSFVAYDLDAMLTPTTAATEDLVRLAELAAGRHIRSQGNIVPLSGEEWLEHWRHLQGSETSRLLEAIQPSPAAERQREAQRLVVSFFERLIKKPAVLKRLRQDVNLGEDLRAEAVARAERYFQNPRDLNEQAWFVVRSPDGSAENYARALLQAEEACSLQPENGLSLNTLGVAQYRVGKYQEAIDTLTHSDKLNRKTFGNSLPADLAFLSMAQHRLDQNQQSLATFERLRQIMSAPEQAKAPSAAEDEATRNENRAIFREAEETIVGKVGPSQRDNGEKKP